MALLKRTAGRRKREKTLGENDESRKLSLPLPLSFVFSTLSLSLPRV
jgi:hypothetical protein